LRKFPPMHKENLSVNLNAT